MGQELKPCGSCAFRAGCKTYDTELYNRLRSEICAISGVPFYCHTGFDWRKHDGHGDNLPDRKLIKICQGWKKRIQIGVAEGRFKLPAQRRLIRMVGVRLLINLETLVKLPDGDPGKAPLHESIAAGFLLLQKWARVHEDTFQQIMDAHRPKGEKAVTDEKLARSS